jgi:hypothetical protein
MNAVHALEILGRNTEEADTSVKVVEVKGSKGNTYQVTLQDGVAQSCTCPGYQFRRDCRHLKTVETAAEPQTVDRSGKQGDRVALNVVRKETLMDSFKQLSWNERFGLIDALNPTDEQVMAVLDIDRSELQAARELRDAGTFKPDLGDLNAQDYASVFANATPAAEPSTEAPAPARATRARKASAPATATKPIREPKKRGRKGTKIQDAFKAIGADPVPLEEFASRFAVSTNVLRQAKRFDRSGVEGRVRVKQVNGTLSIFREPVTAEK